MLLLWIYLAGVLVMFPFWVWLTARVTRQPSEAVLEDESAAFVIAAARKYPTTIAAARAILWPIDVPSALVALTKNAYFNRIDAYAKQKHVDHCIADHGIYAETDDATQFVAVEWFMKHPCPKRQDYLDERFSKMSIFDPKAEVGALPMHMYAVLDFGHPGDQPTVDASCDLCGAILEKANLAAERKKNTPLPKGAILPSGGFAPKGKFVAVDATLDSISIHETANEAVVVVEAAAPDGMTLVASTDRRRLAIFHEWLTKFLEPVGDPSQDIERFRWNLKSNNEDVEQVNRRGQDAPRN